MAEKVNLFNPHDGLTGRDGGPYLDQEERRLAEIVRAAKEDREPDLEHASATAGTPLVTAATLVRIANPSSNPSQENADPYAYAVDALAEDEDFPVGAFFSRDKTDEEVENEKKADEADIHNNPASATVVSHDDEDTDKETREVKQDHDKTPAKDSESASSKSVFTKEDEARQPAKATAKDKNATSNSPSQSPGKK